MERQGTQQRGEAFHLLHRPVVGPEDEGFLATEPGQKCQIDIDRFARFAPTLQSQTSD